MATGKTSRFVVPEMASVLLALTLTAVFLTPLRSLDLWWHLDSGRWMLAHGRYLGEEVRSFSLPGAAWPNFSWLFQVLVAGVQALAGFWGLLGLKALVWWGILWLLMRSAPRVSPWAWLLTVLAVSWQIFPSMHLRPHLFEGLFLAASVGLFHRPGLRHAGLWTALLALLWANMHASAVVGAVALALHLLLPEWRQPGPALLRRLPLAALPGLLVFATPNGLQILDVLHAHAGGEYLHTYIREWLAPQTLPPLMFVILAGIAASLWLRRPVLAPAELFLVLVFLLIGGDSKRFLYELGLVLIRPGALLLDALLRRVAGQGRVRGGLFALLVLLALVGIYRPPLALHSLRLADYPVQTRLYPGVAMPLLRPLLGGDRPLRVWNAYGWGGYLGWQGRGRLLIYIDGRTPTVFTEEMLLQASLARHRPRLLRRLLKRYAVDALVLRIGGGLPFPPGDADWVLVGFDSVSLVYLRGDLARARGLAPIRFDPLRPRPVLPPAEAAGQVEALRTLLGRYPDNALAWRRLAQLLENWPGEPDLIRERREAWRRALALDPGDVQAGVGLAGMLLDEGDKVTAGRVLESVLTAARGPDLTAQAVRLAGLLLALDRPRRALQVLSPDDSRAHQALDRDPRVWRLRARALDQLGDRARAGMARRMAERLMLDGPR